MKLLTVFIALIFLTFSCSEKSSNNPSKNTDAEEIIEQDSIASDSLTEFHFIDDYINSRKLKFSSSLFEIEVNVLIKKEDFIFVNFIEKVDGEDYTYCLSVNGSENHIKYFEEQSHFVEIQDHMESLDLPYQFFIGKAESFGDVNGDKNEDFIVSNHFNSKTTTIDNAFVLTYDGETKLLPSRFNSSSYYEDGSCEHFSGFKEKITYSKDDPFEIIIQRTENKYNLLDCEFGYALEYEKKHKWKIDQWTTSVAINTPNLIENEEFKDFPNKFSRLSKINGEFVIEEHCQNGGASLYLIKKISPTDGSYFFVLNTTDDNIDSYFLAGFNQKDEFTYVLHWRPFGEYSSGGDFDAIEKGGILQSDKITKDTLVEDRYYINGEPHTVNPNNYRFIPCNY